MAFLIWLSRNSFCTFSRRSIFGFGRIFDAFIFAHFNSCNFSKCVVWIYSSHKFKYWTEIFAIKNSWAIFSVPYKIPRFPSDFRLSIRYKNFRNFRFFVSKISPFGFPLKLSRINFLVLKCKIIPVAILSRNPTWLLKKFRFL